MIRLELQNIQKPNFNRIQLLILTALFAALTAAGGFIKIPLPVIPFTLQLPVVILSGLVLGSKYGALSQIIYLLLGIAGLPVFTKGGGIRYVFEPSFGYILGFVLVSWFVGLSVKFTKKTLTRAQKPCSFTTPTCAEWAEHHAPSERRLSGKNSEKSIRTLIYCFIGILLDYLIGTGWMYVILNIYLGESITIWQAIWSGMGIFIIKDLILCWLTVVLYQKIKIFNNFSPAPKPRDIQMDTSDYLIQRDAESDRENIESNKQ